jgi:hypothetical protein
MIHKGDRLEQHNVKYVIRSDVVLSCKRPDNYNHYWQRNLNFIRCVELYREAFNQELDGNKEKPSSLYQKAIAMRQYNKE